MSSAARDASEVAQVYAQLVADHKAFPDQAAGDLLRLLGHNLTVPSPAERRSARLGLVIELVSSGEYITTDLYDRVRAERAAIGEEWPSSSALRDAYGHWLVALKAACRFWFDGGSARVPSSGKHAKRHAGYSPRDILWSIARFHSTQGRRERWPTEWEFENFSYVERRLAERAGKVARVPSLKQIRKAYGSFDAAVNVAQRLYERSPSRALEY